MSNKAAELKSENVSVVMNRKPGAQVVLDITVFPKATEAAYVRAVKNINKEISVPGFRKGKAPDDFVIKNYSKQIESEWKNILIHVGVQESLALLNGIRPYRNDAIRCTSIKSVSKDQGAQFVVEFESAPEVPVVNLNDITLSHVERPPVTQPQIDRVLEDIRFRLAKWEEISDRGVNEDDYVDLDIDKIDEPQENICTDARFSVKEMAPWMKRLVIGLKPTESAEGISEKDVDSTTQESESFQATTCRITLRAIKQAILPELNDDLAKKIGLESLSSLQEHIVADLNMKADQDVREALSRQIDQCLLEKYYFDIPFSLLKNETEQRMQESVEWLKQNTASTEDFEKKEQELKKNLPAQVEKSCRLFFLLVSIANQHKVTVSKEEVAQEMYRQIVRRQQEPLQLDHVDLENRIRQQLMLRKSREYIMNHVKRA